MAAPAISPRWGRFSLRYGRPEIDREKMASDEEHPPARGVRSELPVFAPEESYRKKNSGLAALAVG
jgi:hypothetical protein